jgi:PilZ domain
MAVTQPADTKERNWIADPGRRRSMRVLLSVPITAMGQNGAGKEFVEETRTLVVNAHGALITLAAQIAAGQQIRISHRATEESLMCRVVHIGSVQAGRAQVGIEFQTPSPTFWQIDFPPEDWVSPES